MTQAIPHKRGDTFVLKGVIKVEGVAQDITNWGIRSQVRKGTALVEELLVAKTNAALGEYVLRSQGQTLDWPLGVLSFDVQYTLPSGQVISTQTQTIQCLADITR